MELIKRFASVTAISLLVVLGACNSPHKSDNGGLNGGKNGFKSGIQLTSQHKAALLSSCCTDLTHMSGQFANPFEISGTGCYDSQGLPKCLLFESDDPAALETAENQYMSVENYRLYVHYFTNAILLVGESGKKVLKSRFDDIAFREAQEVSSETYTEKQKRMLDCAFDVSGYVRTYLEDDPSKLRYLKPQVKDFIESNYASLQDIAKFDRSEDSLKYEIALDNHSEPIRRFCREGGLSGGIIDWSKSDK